ncbi:MAG: hypothetical protein V4569_12570 [Pseudomonadota bacterium]
MHHGPAPTPHQDRLLEHHLIALLGDVDDRAIGLLREQLEWVEVAGGDTLMRERGAGDSMDLAISGRLRACVTDDGVLPRDGGSANNLLVDVMRNVRGIGRVIGVDPSARQHRRKVGVAVAPRA